MITDGLKNNKKPRAVDSRDRALTLYAYAVINYYYLIMIRGSDQDSTSARFYVVSKRTPIIFSSKCFGLDCIFISNGTPTQDIHTSAK